MNERIYWQKIRGICILAVILIHSFIGYNYIGQEKNEIIWIIIRQMINFAVPVFIFMSGYFIKQENFLKKNFDYIEWLITRGGGRLLIPFILWSVFYSMILIMPQVIHHKDVNWSKIMFRFITGKAATPFYYIVVLLQLTLITPCIVKIVHKGKKLGKICWFITPIYIVYVYMYNIITGHAPLLYETLFPAWFIFYYLGIEVRHGMKLNGNLKVVIMAFLVSCLEAFLLKYYGMSSGFYTSQITVGSFLYSISIIGVVLEKVEEDGEKNVLWQMGNCSYGIFYIHMFMLMICGKIIDKFSDNWIVYWGFRFILTTMTSYIVVKIMQNILKNNRKALKYIGFV